MTSLRLGFDTVYPHASLASLDREVESRVSLGRAQLSLLGVTVEGLLGSWCWLVLPAVCYEVLEAFCLGLGMGARKEWGPATLLRIEREAQMCMMQFLSLYNNSVNLKYEVSLWFFPSLMRKERKLRMQGNTVYADWDLEDTSEFVCWKKRGLQDQEVCCQSKTIGRLEILLPSSDGWALSYWVGFFCANEAPQPLANNWDLFVDNN